MPRKPAAMQADMNEVLKVFDSYCPEGLLEMHGGTFVSLCQDCGFIGKNFTQSDAELVFAQVVPRWKRKITSEQFIDALELVATKRGVSKDDVLEDVLIQGPRADLGRGRRSSSKESNSSSSRETSLPALPGSRRSNAGSESRLSSKESTASGKESSRQSSKDSVEWSGRRRASSKDCPATLPPTPPTAPMLKTRRASSKELAALPALSSKPSGRTTTTTCTTYQDTFKSFCPEGSDELDSESFVNLFKECKLLDLEFCVKEAGLLFNKVAKFVERGQRRAGLKQFEEALWLYSQQRGVEYGALLAQVHTPQEQNVEQVH